MRLRKYKGIFFLITTIYSLIFWDFHYSSYIFKKECDSNSGLYIYEKVKLNDSYINKNQDTSDKNFDPRYIINNKRVDKEKLENEYDIQFFSKRVLSKIGPIESIETSITRVSDNKLLGKAVSVRSRQGWLYRLASFGYGYEQCPTKYRESGESMNEHMKNHMNILKSTFYVQ